MAISTNLDYARSINKSVNLFCQGNSEGAFKVLTTVCDDCQVNKIKALFNRFQINPSTGKPELGTTTEPQLAKQIEVILCGEGEAPGLEIKEPTCNALALSNTPQNPFELLCNPGYCLNEIFIQIFSHLNMAEIGKCSRVCRLWRSLICDNTRNDSIWRKLVIEIFGNACGVSNSQKLLQGFKSCHLKSTDELLARFKSFAQKITIDHRARFRCIFSLGNDSKQLFVVFNGKQECVYSLTIPFPSFFNDEETAKDPLFMTHFHHQEDYFMLNSIEDGSETTDDEYDNIVRNRTRTSIGNSIMTHDEQPLKELHVKIQKVIDEKTLQLECERSIFDGECLIVDSILVGTFGTALLMTIIFSFTVILISTGLHRYML